jgi:predicted ferric reductase
MKTVTIHIRRAGDWTNALYELAKKKSEISIMMEGPYGSLGVDLVGDRYKMVMLVSGGIGSKSKDIQ